MSPVPLLRLGVSLLAGARADDPCVSPGRLLCSWACQVTCPQLLTIEIRPHERKGYAMPTDDPETLDARLPAALAAVQATRLSP